MTAVIPAGYRQPVTRYKDRSSEFIDYILALGGTYLCEKRDVILIIIITSRTSGVSVVGIHEP